MNDSDIVDLFLSRDEAAIEQTALKYGPGLRRIAERMLGDKASAEECESETYLRAWQLIPPNEPRGYLFAFLGRIARHVAIDEYRKRGRAKRQGVVCELTQEMRECIPAPDRCESAAEVSELRVVINDYLAGCTAEQRRIFIRRYWFFDTVPEICKRYGFSRSKVKTTLFRMREALRSRLESEGYTV